MPHPLFAHLAPTRELCVARVPPAPGQKRAGFAPQPKSIASRWDVDAQLDCQPQGAVERARAERAREGRARVAAQAKKGSGATSRIGRKLSEPNGGPPHHKLGEMEASPGPPCHTLCLPTLPQLVNFSWPGCLRLLVRRGQSLLLNQNQSRLDGMLMLNLTASLRVLWSARVQHRGSVANSESQTAAHLIPSLAKWRHLQVLLATPSVCPPCPNS